MLLDGILIENEDEVKHNGAFGLFHIVYMNGMPVHHLFESMANQSQVFCITYISLVCDYCHDI